MADDVFYTLRKAGPEDRPTFELAKWGEGYPRPLDIYVQWIPLRTQGFSLQSCNCPSRSHPCKHESISLSLLSHHSTHGMIDHLPFVFWKDGAVYEAKDLPTSKD